MVLLRNNKIKSSETELTLEKRRHYKLQISRIRGGIIIDSIDIKKANERLLRTTYVIDFDEFR